jgi:hypothetical protein
MVTINNFDFSSRRAHNLAGKIFVSVNDSLWICFETFRLG